MIKSYQTAQLLAQELLTQAQENEPQITADLQIIALEVSAEMVGLENKFKTIESLTRKLVDVAGNDLQRLQRKAKKINDALRYTYILPLENYLEIFKLLLERLQEADYQIPEHLIWNAWANIGTQYDKGYRGINIVMPQ